MSGGNQNGIVQQANEPDALRSLNRRLSYLENSDGSSPWITVGDTDPTVDAPDYQNSWEPDPDNPLQFKRFLNWIHFRGGFFGGDDGTVVFTLPSLYLPEADESMLLPLADGSGIGYVEISAETGDVLYLGAFNGSPGTGAIVEITSEDGSVTVTDPTGPVTDLSVNFPTLVVTDGSTSVNPTHEIHFTGATVTAGGLGGDIAEVTIDSGGSVADVTSVDGSISISDPTGPTVDLSVLDSPAIDGVTVTGVPTVNQIIIATDGSNAAWGDAGSASLPAWMQSGSGSPNGAVTPEQVGAVYWDLSDGAYYEAVGATAADWVLLGGNGDTGVAGVYTINDHVQVSDGSAAQLDVQSGDVALQFSSSSNHLWLTGDSLAGPGVLVSDDGSGNPVVGFFNTTGDTQQDATDGPSLVSALISYGLLDPGSSWTGGSLPSWFMSGSGSPVGSVVPTQQGAVYQDTTNGALYEAIGVGDGDWIAVGGDADQTVVGVSASGNSLVLLGGPSGGQLWLSDPTSWVGSANGLVYNAGSDVSVFMGDGAFSSTLIDSLGNADFGEIVYERGIGTQAITSGGLPTFAFTSGVGAQLFQPAFSLADNPPPTLPLTVVGGTDDGICLAGISYFVAAGTYTTVDDLVTALNGSTDANGNPFSNLFVASNDGGSIEIATLVAGYTAQEINFGPHFIVAANPATVPVTVTTGVNDELMLDGTIFTIPAATYTTADDVATVMNSVLEGNVRVVNVAGTLVMDVAACGNGAFLNSGPNDFLAATGFTDGQGAGGSDDIAAALGFDDGQVFIDGIDPIRDLQLIVPITYDPSAGDATCQVELSPDNLSWTTVATEEVPLQLATPYVLSQRLYVPAEWWVRLTVVNATIGTATYY